MGSSTASQSDIIDEKHVPEQDEKQGDFVAVSAREVDTAAELASGGQGEVDPAESLRVR